jgi:hypothetical protein
VGAQGRRVSRRVLAAQLGSAAHAALAFDRPAQLKPGTLGGRRGRAGLSLRDAMFPAISIARTKCSVHLVLPAETESRCCRSAGRMRCIVQPGRSQSIQMPPQALSIAATVSAFGVALAVTRRRKTTLRRTFEILVALSVALVAADILLLVWLQSIVDTAFDRGQYLAGLARTESMHAFARGVFFITLPIGSFSALAALKQGAIWPLFPLAVFLWLGSVLVMFWNGIPRVV